MKNIGLFTLIAVFLMLNLNQLQAQKDPYAERMMKKLISHDSSKALILAKKVVNPDFVSKDGFSLLMIASANGYLEVCKTLIQRGTNLNYQNKEGRTALNEASFNGHTEVVRLLLNYGSEVNLQENNGLTALMCASHSGKTDVLKLLIEKGADVNLQRKDGVTALMIASDQGHSDVIRLLMEHGAILIMKNEDGKTAMDYAKNDSIKDLVQIPLTDIEFINNGKMKYGLNDYIGAIDDYTKAIDYNPQNALAFQLRAQTKMEIKDYNGVVEDYTHKIEIEPEEVTNYLNRAEVFELLGRNQEAVNDYTTAISKIPFLKNVTDYSFWPYIIPSGHRKYGINKEKNIIKKRSLIYLKMGQTENGFISILPNLIIQETKELVIPLLKGDSCLLSGDFKGSVHFYNEVLELVKSGKNNKLIQDYSLNQNDVRVSGNDFQKDSLRKEALKDIARYTKLIQSNPKDTDAYFNRGRIYSELFSQYSKAVNDFTKVIELDSTDYSVYENRGWALEEIGQYNKAINDFSKCINIYKSGWNYYYRGQNYFITGQIDKALEDLFHSVIFDNFLEETERGKGFLSDRIELISFCLIEKKEYEKSIPLFLKSLYLNNKNTDAYLGLAIAYYLSGDKTNAKKFFLNAKELDPDLKTRVLKVQKSPWAFRFTTSSRQILVKMFQEYK